MPRREASRDPYPHSTGPGEPATAVGPGDARRSRQNPVHDIPGDVGEPEVATVVPVRELLVVEPQEVQDRGVQVVDAHPAFDGPEADVVGRPVMHAAPDAPAGHPDGERVRVVVPTAAPLLNDR